MKTLRATLPFLCIAGGFSLILFSSFFTLLSSTGLTSNVPRTQEGIQGEIAHTIPIVLSVQEKRYDLKVPSGTTVYEAMNLARQTAGLDFKGRDFEGLGFFVEEINGIPQNPLRQMYWIYSINGIKSQVGVSSYTLSPGDVISWTYEHEE